MKDNTKEQNNHTFGIRPAFENEVGYFYAQGAEKDMEQGCIGHVRIDFGHHGQEFWHTWHPRGPQEWNTPVFKEELTTVVDELRKSVLSSLPNMRQYCAKHGGAIDGAWTQNYGYVVEGKNYLYCLRCNPVEGDYQAYLNCFDKRIPELRQAEQPERDAQMAELLQKGNLIWAYVYEGNGREEFMFEGTPENIASFLGSRPAVDSITLTDSLDCFVLDTFGNFINRCPDQNLLAQVMQSLGPIQMGEAEVPPFFCPTIQEVEAYQEQHHNETMEMGGM